jgi:uncharacterized protein
MIMKRLILFFMILFLASSVQAAVSHYINDNAGVISPETAAYLEQALKELEQNTNGVQVVVYTENKLPEGTTLEERSLKLAEDLGVGKKGADNGVLLYLSTEDRQFRWEVGYGAEATLNSAWLGRMSREQMVPRFQEGDFENGIIYGLAGVEDKLLVTSNSDVSGGSISNPTLGYASWWFIILVILLLIILSVKYSTRSIPIIMGSTRFIKGASNIFTGGFNGGGGKFGGGGFSGKF